jgi:transposase-like protein
MIRNSLRYVPYKDRKDVAGDLKHIYGAVSLEKAEYELKNFGKKWNKKYPMIHKMWSRNWETISTYFAYSPAIRKVIYTTNAIESLNYSLRKITKTRGAFPTEDAALKLLYLGIKKVSRKWKMPIRDWGLAVNQLAVLFGDRVPIYEVEK